MGSLSSTNNGFPCWVFEDCYVVVVIIGGSVICISNFVKLRDSVILWVYPNKGTQCDIGLCLVSDAHDCLPAGLEMACDG